MLASNSCWLLHWLPRLHPRWVSKSVLTRSSTSPQEYTCPTLSRSWRWPLDFKELVGFGRLPPKNARLNDLVYSKTRIGTMSLSFPSVKDCQSGQSLSLDWKRNLPFSQSQRRCGIRKTHENKKLHIHPYPSTHTISSHSHIVYSHPIKLLHLCQGHIVH